MPGRLDKTLQANLATGMLMPRLDHGIGHGLKYLVQQLGATVGEFLQRFSRRQPQADQQPRLDPRPGNAASMMVQSRAGNVHLPTAVCAETGKEVPWLPTDQCDQFKAYAGPISAAGNPANCRVPDGYEDAFNFTVEGPNGDKKDILPPSLTTSSLLNYKLPRDILSQNLNRANEELKLLETEIPKRQKGLDTLNSEENEPRNAFLQSLIAGETQEIEELRLKKADYKEEIAIYEADLKIDSGTVRRTVQSIPNTLFDPLTGFAASIMVRPGDREVVISFSGMGSQGAGLRQGFRCGFNILGLSTPKNFSQASKLTQMVKAHLEAINKDLPDDRKFKVKLSGHSMGGGMATYAALRNDVEAVVFNPLRLGLLTRAKVGRPALKNAPKFVKEVVVQTDWVADNKWSKFYKLLNIPSVLLTGRKADTRGAIGQRYMVPKPTEDQMRNDRAYLKHLVQEERETKIRKFDVHVNFMDAIDLYKRTSEPEADGIDGAVFGNPVNEFGVKLNPVVDGQPVDDDDASLPRFGPST